MFCNHFLSILHFSFHFIPSSLLLILSPLQSWNLFFHPILDIISPFLPPTCSVATLLLFFFFIFHRFCFLLHFLSPLPLTPLVIMVNSCYDKPRLDLFLSPRRQVLDIHPLLVCVCVCLSVSERHRHLCTYIFTA